jgi:hypothetical protein
MDFQADEDLLEALLVFFTSIPMQDLSQVRPYLRYRCARSSRR